MDTARGPKGAFQTKSDEVYKNSRLEVDGPREAGRWGGSVKGEAPRQVMNNLERLDAGLQKNSGGDRLINTEVGRVTVASKMECAQGQGMGGARGHPAQGEGRNLRIGDL